MRRIRAGIPSPDWPPSLELPAALFTRVPADAGAIASAIRALFLDVPRAAAALARAAEHAEPVVRHAAANLERLLAPTSSSG